MFWFILCTRCSSFFDELWDCFQRFDPVNFGLYSIKVKQTGACKIRDHTTYKLAHNPPPLNIYILTRIIIFTSFGGGSYEKRLLYRWSVLLGRDFLTLFFLERGGHASVCRHIQTWSLHHSSRYEGFITTSNRRDQVRHFLSCLKSFESGMQGLHTIKYPYLKKHSCHNNIIAMISFAKVRNISTVSIK